MNKSEKFWDNVSKTYDKDEKHFELIHNKVVENTKKYLNARDIVLDYGCATGTKTLELAGDVNNIQGFDISSKMIKIAKRKATENKIENVDFGHTTIFDEKYKRESFDVILAFNILHAIEDNQQVIKRISELLKSSGLFISTTPCLKEEMAFLTKFKLSFYLLLIKMGFVPNILTRFKINEIRDLITNGNFQIIETENIYHQLSNCFVVAKKA
jgi:2-polyprenyl-3-methyl-5-hydroxy-6-metoxy-1,4-benzoquinol methylase